MKNQEFPPTRANAAALIQAKYPRIKVKKVHDIPLAVQANPDGYTVFDTNVGIIYSNGTEFHIANWG